MDMGCDQAKIIFLEMFEIASVEHMVVDSRKQVCYYLSKL